MLNIGIIGDNGVGKTTLLEKIAENRPLLKRLENEISIHEVLIGETKINFCINHDGGITLPERNFDVILYLFDNYREAIDNDMVKHANNCKLIFCHTKSDTLDNISPGSILPKNTVFISGKTGQGVDALLDLIFKIVRM